MTQKNTKQLGTKNLTKHLKNYKNLSSGLPSLASTKKLGESIINPLSLLLTLPVVGLVESGHAQCLGAVNNGNGIQLAQGASTAFDVDGVAGNDIKIYVQGLQAASLKIAATGTAGVQLICSATVASASITPFAVNATVTGTKLKTNDAFIAYSKGTQGAITNGTTQYIGFKIGNREGFVELTVNHNNSTAYTINILERATQSVAFGNAGTVAKAGDCSTIPVELISFKGREIDNQSVKLEWVTGSETNNAGFEIERSEDGLQFRSVAWIEGQGTSYENKEYHYNDANLRQGQRYYYRLKQVDYDGNFNYSEVISMALNTGSVVSSDFYPNPSTSGLTKIDFFTKTAGDWSVLVYDATGKEVLAENRQLTEGDNTLDFDFSALSGGLFYVKFENGDERVYRKLSLEK